MASNSKINIVSDIGLEFSSNLTIGEVTYPVQTEDMGTMTCKVISRVYLKGQVVLARKTDYSSFVNAKNRAEKLKALMRSNHKATIDAFIKGMTEKQKTKADYIEEVKVLLRTKNGKAALEMLKKALELFAADPFLMSYYGCLIAVVENKPEEGIKICQEAIEKIRGSLPLDSESPYPVFCLNLGRAFLKADLKAGAFSAFQEGLQNDPENQDLQWELRKLGIRKKPLVPFLKRSNPINKYLAILLSKKAR